MKLGAALVELENLLADYSSASVSVELAEAERSRVLASCCISAPDFSAQYAALQVAVEKCEVARQRCRDVAVQVVGAIHRLKASDEFQALAESGAFELLVRQSCSERVM
jgi:hypothetical protein